MGNSVNQNENCENPTVLLRRLHYWRMAFFGVVILLAGMLSGAAATLLMIGHTRPRGPLAPIPAVRLLLERLSGPLHLTTAQEQQVEPILQKHMAKLDQIQEQGHVASVLTEDQMHLWERLFLDLPGSIRHIPQERGPGLGRGPAPGPGGWRGPPADRRGPLHVPYGPPPAPDTNAVQHN